MLVIFEGTSQVETTVRAVLADILGLSADRVAAFTDDTPLFGALPELDSMAVASVLTDNRTMRHFLRSLGFVEGPVEWGNDTVDVTRVLNPPPRTPPRTC